MNKETTVEDLVGLTMSSVKNINDEELVLTSEDGRVFKFYHNQDCCENVWIESIVGELDDLIGEPILLAEEVSSDGIPSLDGEESFTWTFYKFATRKGYVDVRWYGESNGYYSEEVTFRECDL